MLKAIKIFYFFLALLLFSNADAQIKLPEYPDSLFTTYYQQKASFAAHLPYTKDDIVFLGNSITDGAVWSELFNDIHVKSRGFSGDISAGIIHRFANIVADRYQRFGKRYISR